VRKGARVAELQGVDAGDRGSRDLGKEKVVRRREGGQRDEKRKKKVREVAVFFFYKKKDFLSLSLSLSLSNPSCYSPVSRCPSRTGSA
jgi:hypothetical protein